MPTVCPTCNKTIGSTDAQKKYHKEYYNRKKLENGITTRPKKTAEQKIIERRKRAIAHYYKNLIKSREYFRDYQRYRKKGNRTVAPKKRDESLILCFD